MKNNEKIKNKKNEKKSEIKDFNKIKKIKNKTELKKTTTENFSSSVCTELLCLQHSRTIMKTTSQNKYKKKTSAKKQNTNNSCGFLAMLISCPTSLGYKHATAEQLKLVNRKQKATKQNKKKRKKKRKKKIAQ